ncbi:hypothetical protein B9J75_08295 [Leuconostoc citreum]|uniref:hypothetical protein n=1 Tax=Leuconostoc citreum TaxID=33964 RepID=UPI000A1FAD66|nr:hypothetical protein [Leuconostoc citreum]OSP81191.1 hypothetical protein B9J75_08295 [Leuconostoc citreum]
MNETYFDFKSLEKSIDTKYLYNQNKDNLEQIIDRLKISNAILEVEFLKNLGINIGTNQKGKTVKQFVDNDDALNEFSSKHQISFIKSDQPLYTSSEGGFFVCVNMLISIFN